MKNLSHYILPTLLVTLIIRVSGQIECKEDFGLLCQSSRFVHSLIDKLNEAQVPIVIIPGLEIVLSNSSSKAEIMNEASLESKDDGSIVGRIRNYLKMHEINIKLKQFLDALSFLNGNEGDSKPERLGAEARKKDGKMQLMAISLMFTKILAFLKIGSLAALAMKALGIASMALLISVMLGLKTLQQSAQETSHHVQYISDGHHLRRRRYIEPYLTPVLPFPLQYKNLHKA